MTEWWTKLCCFALGHQWYPVYKNPYSQHPITVTDERDRMKFKCSRCDGIGWR